MEVKLVVLTPLHILLIRVNKGYLDLWRVSRGYGMLRARVLEMSYLQKEEFQGLAKPNLRRREEV